jgi:predicted ATPase with chaperone activity
MSAHVKCLLDSGNTGIVIDIECHIPNGLQNIVVVGFATKTVDESTERIRVHSRIPASNCRENG